MKRRYRRRSPSPFADALAALADAYVGDGFGAVHRKHASVYDVPKRLPHAAGRLVLGEVEVLRRLTENVERPYAVVRLHQNLRARDIRRHQIRRALHTRELQIQRIAQRPNEQRFADDIRSHLSFLFTEHAAQIIPNQGTPFPPSFDGAYVTVAVGAVQLRFVRGRGDFSVSVASEFAPQHWEDVRLVADDIGEWDTSKSRRYSYSLETFDSVLRPRLAGLQEALSKDRFETTLNRAVRTHNESVDEYAAKLRGAGIILKFIEPSSR